MQCYCRVYQKEEQKKFKVARSSYTYLKSLNHSFVTFGGLIWILVYVFSMKTFTGQASPKFKTVCQGYGRIIQEILRRCGYISPKVCQFLQHFAVIFLHDSFLKKKIDGLYLLCYPNIWVGAVGSCWNCWWVV